MTLTPTQEEQLIHQYDRLLWDVVHRFKRRKYDAWDDREDLHSECMLVFLRHIRSCKTMDEVKRIPISDMINAMCRQVLVQQTCSHPKRTSDFKQVIDSAQPRVDYDEVENVESQGCHCAGLDDALDEIAFSDFCASLSPQEQEIIRMKMDGCTNRQIAQTIGVTDVIMTRTIKKLLVRYRALAA